MADIAMLVAEEYERRVKNSSSSRKQEIVKEINNDAAGEKVVKVSIRNFVGEEKIEEFVKWVLEPRSQIGAAASVGFFSA